MFQNIKKMKKSYISASLKLKGCVLNITSPRERIYIKYIVNSIHFKHNKLYTKISIIN
jgi:hypothetical protein